MSEQNQTDYWSTTMSEEINTITVNDNSSVVEGCSSKSIGVYNIFHMCLESGLQHVGFAVSFIAIALWFASHFIILRTNHQEFKATFNRLFFIFHLTVANVCNLIGCLLSNQIGTMVLTAIYFLVMDAIFIGQYFYYVHKRKPGSQDGFHYSNFSQPSGAKNSEWKNKSKQTGSLGRHRMNGSGFQVLCIGTSCVLTISYLSSWLMPRPQSEVSVVKWSPSGRVLLGKRDDFLQENGEKAGYVIGWIASLLYCAYKIPEVISMKRHRLHMGRSFYSHFLQIFANMTYVLAILAYDKETRHVLDTLPWTIGSIAMITFDLIILYHILKYKRPKSKRQTARNTPGYQIADLHDEEDPNGNNIDGDEDDVDSWVQMGDVGGSLPRIEEEDEDEERNRVVDMVTAHAKVELVNDENFERTRSDESIDSIYLDSVDEPVRQDPQDLEWDESDISRVADTSKREELCEEDVMAEIEQELGMSVEEFLAADSQTIRSPKTTEFMREQENIEIVEATDEGMDEEGDALDEQDLEEFWEELNIMKA